MPAIKPIKHELFVQGVAKGKSATESYRLAGYAGADGVLAAAASRLLKTVKVQSRLTELQNKVAERAEITLRSLIEDADRIQRGAERDGQWSAANSALQSKAKLAGKWIDRHEHGSAGAFEALSDAELRVQINIEGAELGLAIPAGETAH